MLSGLSNDEFSWWLLISSSSESSDPSESSSSNSSWASSSAMKSTRKAWCRASATSCRSVDVGMIAQEILSMWSAVGHSGHTISFRWFESTRSKLNSYFGAPRAMPARQLFKSIPNNLWNGRQIRVKWRTLNYPIIFKLLFQWQSYFASVDRTRPVLAAFIGRYGWSYCIFWILVLILAYKNVIRIKEVPCKYTHIQ